MKIICNRRISMRNVVVILLIFLCSSFAESVTDKPYAPLNSRPLIGQQDCSGFNFGVFGDFRPLRRDRPYPSAYGQILDEMAAIRPSFVMSLGDAYYGYGGSFQRFKNEVDYFLSTIKPLSFPFFNIIGNHDVTDDKERDDYVRGRFGNSYGSFDFCGSHLIVLDSDEKGREGTISGDQLLWLEKDLAANDKATNIFIFLHRPLFSKIDPEFLNGKSFKDRAGRDALHSLFVRHKVKAVFAAHEHLFSDAINDGVRYIISGGGGAPLYSPPQDAGFFHYIIVSVKDRDMRLEVTSPYAIQIRTLFNNYGIEPRAEIEVVNTSNTGIQMNGIPVRMPRTDLGAYRVRAISLSARGETMEHDARINSVIDNGDGTSTLGVGTFCPQNGLLRITVEASL